MKISTFVKGKKSALAAAIVLSFGVTASAHANMLTNGDFETGDFTGWNIASEYTDVITTSSNLGGAQSGNYFAVMGAVGTLGTVSQTVSTSAGQSYDLSYWFASDGYGPNYFDVLWNGVQIDGSVEDNAGRFGWAPFSFTVVGTGNDVLTFRERHDLAYLGLDNVLTRLPTAGTTAVVPVPAAVWLFSSGLVGMLGMSRRAVRNNA